MGMYTELHFNAALKRDTPQTVLDALADMTGQVPTEPGKMPDHPLFATGRWDVMLQCSSMFFPLSTASSVDFDPDSRSYKLRVRSNFKNYDDEIALFLDWIRPHLDVGDECLGFYRHEESDHPTLIYAAGEREVGA